MNLEQKNRTVFPTSFLEYNKRRDEITEHTVESSQPAAEPTLLISTRLFGEVSSYLNTGFDQDAPTLERDVPFDFPPIVAELCQQIKRLGGRALVVGGSVRDALLSDYLQNGKISAKDVDLEVYGLALPDLYRFLITQYGEAALNTVGKAFGVIKLSVEGLQEPIDISIPRRDSKVNVEDTGFMVEGDPTMTIREASRRRDLRINSIACDPIVGKIYDPFGAEYDMVNKQISVTDPEKFIEDPVRVLRVMQFAARFEMQPTAETIELCKQLVNSGRLDTEPIERVSEEFKKLLLKGKKPSIGLEFAKQVGLVERFWPEFYALIGVQQNPEWHPEGDVWVHTLQTVDAASEIAQRENLSAEKKLVLLLTMISHDLGKPQTTVFERGAWRAPGHEPAGVVPAASLLARFNFPEKLVAEVLALVPEHMNPKMLWLNQFPKDGQEPKDMSNALRRLATRLGDGNTSMYMLSLVVEADQRGRNGDENVPLTREQVPELEDWQGWFMESAKELGIEASAPQPLLLGRDLLEYYQLKKGGKWVGVLLQLVFLDQLDGVVKTQADALQQAEMYFQNWCLKMNMAVGMEPAVLNHDHWRDLGREEDPRLFFN